jgi:hypothetical protein
MTQPKGTDPLEPELRDAEEELKRRLEEACDVGDPRGETTGELERLEEDLTEAAKAAKQAVTLRRRLRARGTAEQPGQTGRADRAAVRQFADRAGRRWRVWEVQPGAIRTRTAQRAAERSTGEHLEAWLAFQSLEGPERRRLTPFPSGWLTLPDDELLPLLEGALVVPELRLRPGRSAEEQSPPQPSA